MRIRNFVAPAVLACAFLFGCGAGGPGGLLGELPPSVQIWANLMHGTIGKVLQFYGQGSNPDGGAVSYAWDFDGDGVTDSTLQSPSYAFATEGVKSVSLKVTDGEGRTSTANMVVTAFAAPKGAAPNVSVRAFTMNGATPFEVFFRADASDPDGGAIVLYEWDFNGDGAVDAAGPSPYASFTYATRGAYTTSVTATDSGSVKSTASVVVAVCEHRFPDMGPAAMILAETPLIGPAPLSVSLFGFGSDMDGGPSTAKWSWDEDGDGAADRSASGRSVSITGLAAGAHRIELEIEDDNGREASKAEIVVVATGADAPSAWAFADAITASPGTSIQFHARAVDPNGDALSYSWDFDGDGIEDSTAVDPIFPYAMAGFYIPQLLVSDGKNSSSSSLSVVIESCRQEQGPYFWYDCADLTINHGESGVIVMAPGISILGSYPKTAQLLGKAGPLGVGGDPAGGEIVVTDAAGGVAPPDVFMFPVPPTPAPVATGLVGPGAFVAATVTSIEWCHGRPTSQYTIRIRLVDPGVRVQICKCTVYVLHPCTVANK